MYRPNREGGFLRELLHDFRGVLVSDFYSAYDALPCVQQKCLIHLMRDMNQDLLNNPFDEDLKSITRPFGALLRTLVSTVDQHGLRQCHLKNARGSSGRPSSVAIGLERLLGCRRGPAGSPPAMLGGLIPRSGDSECAVG